MVFDNDGYKSSAPMAQLGGAKRKNGHKSNCACHICENMKNKVKRGGYEEDAEKEALKKMGGSKKKNGHKPDCKCPICKNMNCAKKGKKGGEGEEIKADPDDYEKFEGGSRKKRSLKKNKRKTNK